MIAATSSFEHCQSDLLQLDASDAITALAGKLQEHVESVTKAALFHRVSSCIWFKLTL